MQPRATAEAVAEVFVGKGRNHSFVGVRRFQEEYCLLFRCAADRESVSFLGYIIGEAGAGRVTLVDVYSFAPTEMLSDPIRRQCLVVLSNLDQTLLEVMEPRQRDFLAAQTELTRFGSACEAGDNAAAVESYARLPVSLRTEKFVLFNRTRVALQASEPEFLAAVLPWRESYPNDPALEMFVSSYYWTKNDDAKALKAFERLNELLGGDP